MQTRRNAMAKQLTWCINDDSKSAHSGCLKIVINIRNTKKKPENKFDNYEMYKRFQPKIASFSYKNFFIIVKIDLGIAEMNPQYDMLYNMSKMILYES